MGPMDRASFSIHPGQLLLEEFLKPLGISQNRLARDIDVPVSRIAAIVAGERAITADTAMRFAAYFDTKPELWMKLQAAYEIAVLRETNWPRIEARIRPYEPVDGVTPSQTPCRSDEDAPTLVSDFGVDAGDRLSGLGR